MPHFGDGVYQHGGDPVGDTVQGNTYFVDNRLSAANNNNTGRRKDRPKTTIQSAIDEAIPGSVIKVMGSGRIMEYSGTGFHALTGADLYGVYREQIELPYDLPGLQIIGFNRPLITGQVGTEQNTDGATPTVQIGTFGEDHNGPLYCKIKGFHIGGFGDSGSVGGERYGVGINIGQFDDVNYIDDCYSHIIEDCYFRQTNCVAAGQDNDTDVHCWIKTWGNEKIEIKRSFFFQGYYAIGLMGSSNNQSMSCQITECDFQYQATYCVYGSGTNLWCQIKDSTFNPQASNTELNLVGGLGSKIIRCAFPLCDEIVETNRDTIAAETIGTHTGWQVMGCYGQLGHIYAPG